MKPWIIIQARATSTRLPGKIFQEVCGKSLLEHQIARLKNRVDAEGILVATTRNESDDRTVALCRTMGIPFFRGDENDVLSRYFEAALFCCASSIVRITSDCPLIDVHLVNQIIHKFADSKVDYVSNTVKRTYPRGLDTEVFSFDALKTAYFKAVSLSDREHVTPFIRNHSSEFTLASIEAENDRSFHRWTVDTKEDFDLIRKIYEALYEADPLFETALILKLLERNPDWIQINAHIEQKKID